MMPTFAPPFFGLGTPGTPVGAGFSPAAAAPGVSAAAAGPPTGAPHFPQKADPSATSFPHFGQNITTYLSSLFPSK